VRKFLPDFTDVVSNAATVTVQVNPVEALAVNRAEFRLRQLTYDIRGTGTVPGSVLTISLGANPGGPIIGTATVDAAGRWAFVGRGSLPGTSSISIVSTGGAQLAGQPLRIR